MINDGLMKLIKCTLNADVTPMQKQILKGVLRMVLNRLCYDIDITLSNIDRQSRRG
jgi:hypothetical protein